MNNSERAIKENENFRILFSRINALKGEAHKRSWVETSSGGSFE
jgi:hypothetical protein